MVNINMAKNKGDNMKRNPAKQKKRINKIRQVPVIKINIGPREAEIISIGIMMAELIKKGEICTQ